MQLGNYRSGWETAGLRIVVHKGRVVMIGIKSAPLLALAGGGWTQPLPLSPSPGSDGAAETVFYAEVDSLRLW